MMRPRKKSNSFKESSKCTKKELVSTIQRRRSTLAQVLFGEKEERKREKDEQKFADVRESGTKDLSASISSSSSFPNQNHLQSFEKKGKNLLGSGFLAQPFLQKRTEECLMRPKLMHVMVMGPKKAGKTVFLRVLAQQNHLGGPSTSASAQDQYLPTQEDDTYHIQLCGGGNAIADSRHSREFILFHDTPGILDFGNIELKKAHLQAADAFLLFYSVLDPESFNRVDLLKKQLEKEKLGGSSKDKREVQIVVIGTKIDLPNRKVDPEFALHWANRERVKLFETSTLDRDSIIDVVHHLSGKFFNRDAKFSLSRRLKPEKSNSQILMDF